MVGDGDGGGGASTVFWPCMVRIEECATPDWPHATSAITDTADRTLSFDVCKDV